MAAVSIIVPIYNVEKYLERCVNSIQAQTLQDIEIILVDDGSPDQCPQMCDQYAIQDARIKVIHKQNGGLSSARNAGMDAATGQYIGFVDADDTSESDMYERMFEIIWRHQVDFVMSDYQRILADNSSYLKTLQIRPGLYYKENIVKEIFPSLIMGENLDYGPLLSVCHCLYDLSFLKCNQIRFDEEVRWSEDNIFSAFVGYHANYFYYLKGEGLYHYRQNEGTITTSYRKDAWEVYCKMNEHLREFFENVQDYDFSHQLKLHTIYYACNCLGQMKFLEKGDRVKYVQHILDSKSLEKAFSSFSFQKISKKMYPQLWMMKHKKVQMLIVYIMRRA